MFSPTVFLLLLLAVWSASAGDVVFEDSSSTNNGNNNVGTRNGPFDDSVVIEAAGSPSGDVDSRFFGLGLLGGGGLLGGNRPYGGGVGGGYPGGAFGATKPGKCPGILGLGIGQPEGGYYPGGGYGGGFGHHGGYGGYPGGGIYPGGYGGYGYPGQYGHGGGFGGFGGFRSGDQGEENGEKSNEGRRKRSDEAHKESGDVQGRALPGDHNTDARFLPGITGLFGQQCYHDSQCPGQLKCCGKGLGHGATCQQPAIFG